MATFMQHTKRRSLAQMGSSVRGNGAMQGPYTGYKEAPHSGVWALTLAHLLVAREQRGLKPEPMPLSRSCAHLLLRHRYQ